MEKTTIVFEDHQQDFLEWDLDNKGYVIDCRPFQAWIWCGLFVPHSDSLQAGQYVEIVNEDGRHSRIKYPLKEVRHERNRRVQASA